VLDDDVSLLPHDALVRAFRSLPVSQREVLFWTEIEGLSPAELGELLDIASPAVSSLVLQARQGLREAYFALFDDVVIDLRDGSH